MLVPESRQFTFVLLIELIYDKVCFIIRRIGCRWIEEQSLTHNGTADIGEVHGIMRRRGALVVSWVQVTSAGATAKYTHGIVTMATGSTSIVIR